MTGESSPTTSTRTARRESPLYTGAPVERVKDCALPPSRQPTFAVVRTDFGNSTTLTWPTKSNDTGGGR